MRRVTRLCCASAVLTAISAPVFAGDITTEWASVKPPPVPELKPVTVDPKTTAVLVLDSMKGNCGQRPLCLATIPNVKKLLDVVPGPEHDVSLYPGRPGSDTRRHGRS